MYGIHKREGESKSSMVQFIMQYWRDCAIRGIKKNKRMPYE